MKRKNHFLVGLIAVVLPVVLGDKLLAAVPYWLVNPIEYYLCLPEFFARIFGLGLLFGVIWGIGLFINQGKFGIALKNWVVSIVVKIPVIGDVFRILGQVVSTLKYTDSFKEVVLVEYPRKGMWAPAYVAHENEEYLTIHLPSAPSAWTAPQLLIVNKCQVKRTNIKPQSLFKAVLTLGTTADMQEIMKEVERIEQAEVK